MKKSHSGNGSNCLRLSSVGGPPYLREPLKNFTKNRTPKEIVTFAKEYFSKNRLIIETVDKKAYLSSLALSKYLVVTCDSSSMISEAALTGKPIYVAMIPSKKNDRRFRKFRSLFESLNIIKELGDKLTFWSYENLNETNRIALKINKLLK